MPLFAGRVIFLKVDRVFKLLILLLSFILIVGIHSKWSPKSSERKSVRQEINYQIDLAKYIHIDLKGAPPKADKFYELFFDFLEKIQMGVKGVIIEYEDTLPLQGNLVNVSIEKSRIVNVENKFCFFEDYSSFWLYKI